MSDRSRRGDEPDTFIGTKDQPKELPSDGGLEADFARYYRMSESAALKHARYDHDDAEADDLVQEAAFDLFRKWRKVAPERKKTPGLLVAAVHLCIMRKHEKDKPTVELTEELEEGLLVAGTMEPAPLGLIHQDLEIEELAERVIAALPPRCRKVVLMLRDTDLSFAEIAQTLGMSVSTARNHRANAHRKAFELLGRWGFDLTGLTVRGLLPRGDASTMEKEEPR